MIFRSKPKKTLAEIGAEVVAGVRSLTQSFYEVRVSPLQQALLDVFSKSIDRDLEQFGLNAHLIRQRFSDMDVAWASGIVEMKPEILDFRNMQDWLDCAEATNARNEVLDWLDQEFDSYTVELHGMATAAIGGRVLLFDLPDD